MKSTKTVKLIVLEIFLLYIQLNVLLGYFILSDILKYFVRHLTDPWDNSTLMSYIAPFSGPTLSLGANTSTAITNMERHLDKWLQDGFSQHYQQLSFMERLRNEIILLHAKVIMCRLFQMTQVIYIKVEIEFCYRSKYFLTSIFS